MDPILLVIAAAVVIAAAGGAYLFVRRKGQRRAGEAVVYHFRCPGCRRRLRFSSRQVGRKGKCSHCGMELTFPAVSQSID